MFALLVAGVVGAELKDVPPTWPPPIKPVWPMQWYSDHWTGEYETINPGLKAYGDWWYDYPTDRWRQDTCYT
jgi:hypothetical protein